MRKFVPLFIIGGFVTASSYTFAQAPKSRGNAPPAQAGASDLVGRMMAFDKDKDGELTRAEVTDARLKRLFDRADADKDGIVTKEELTALAAKEAPAFQGGPGRRGPGGPGGMFGPGGPPRPGQILPVFMQAELGLSEAQKTQLYALQKDVDARLAKILTADQKKQLDDMRNRGPGGFGPPGGGPPGFGPPGGGPGGPPPGRPDGPGDDGPR